MFRYIYFLSTGYVVAYMMFLSLFNLMALSLDRYLALCHPLFHRKIKDACRSVRLIMIIWVTPLVLALIPLAWKFNSDEKLQNIAKRSYMMVALVIVFTFIVVITLIYLQIAVIARKTIRDKRKSTIEISRKNDLHRKEARVSHLFGVLLFFFLVAYAPMIYINTCLLVTSRQMCVPWHQLVTVFLLMTNSIVNPICCMLLKRDYMDGIRGIFGSSNSERTSKCMAGRSDSLLIGKPEKVSSECTSRSHDL